MAATRTMEDYVPPASRTLGLHVAAWMTSNLVNPGGDGPFKLTREQFRILCRWYQVDDSGRFTYRRGAIRRLRGWGKSPFLAALSLVEFLGPVRFGGWDEEGYPIAVPVRSPWVQVAAVNLEQTRAVFDVFSELVNERCVERYGLDIGKERIFRVGPGKIQAVTSSPRSLRGARPTFMVLDETSEWVTGNGGHAMLERIKGNLAKSPDGAARMLEISNAFVPGEDSVAEQTYDAWTKNQNDPSYPNDIYYDSIEAPPETSLSDVSSLRSGLEAARGDSTWLDIDRLVAEIMDPNTAPSMARRDYLNQIVAAEDALVRPHLFDAGKTEGELNPGDEITLGFDGSLTDDSTVLVACRLKDRKFFILGIQEKNPLDPDWRVDQEHFDGLVAMAFATYKVVGFYADYHPFETYVDKWAVDYRHDLRVKASPQSAVALDMRGNQKKISTGLERLLDGIANGEVHHNGDTRLRAHWMNARRTFNRFGQLSFRKESRESKRKVDAVAACLLADIARFDYMSNGKKPVNRGMVRLR